jgi:hypothetical protein
MQNKALIISGNILGSAFFLSIPVLLAPGPPSLDTLNFFRTKQELLAYSLLLLFYYIHYYYFIPHYYEAQQKSAYYTILLTALAVIICIPRIVFTPGPDDFMPFPHPRFINLFEMSHHLFLFSAIVFFSLLTYINRKWKTAMQEKTNAELLYLKAQVNPHFLFNTLNSIYSLSLQKSDDTPEAIVKLSALMRYVLTETKDDFIPVNKEIGYIKNYIELQKIRLGNTASVLFEVTEDNTAGVIAPLILIPFIENAFKHGVNPEENSEIKVTIHVSSATLDLLVYNRKVNHVNREDSTGAGLANVQHRLLLSYPGRHQLSINQNTSYYQVNLTLQI